MIWYDFPLRGHIQKIITSLKLEPYALILLSSTSILFQNFDEFPTHVKCPINVGSIWTYTCFTSLNCKRFSIFHVNGDNNAESNTYMNFQGDRGKLWRCSWNNVNSGVPQKNLARFIFVLFVLFWWKVFVNTAQSVVSLNEEWVMPLKSTLWKQISLYN